MLPKTSVKVWGSSVRRNCRSRRKWIAWIPGLHKTSTLRGFLLAEPLMLLLWGSFLRVSAGRAVHHFFFFPVLGWLPGQWHATPGPSITRYDNRPFRKLILAGYYQGNCPGNASQINPHRVSMSCIMRHCLDNPNTNQNGPRFSPQPTISLEIERGNSALSHFVQL